MSFETPLPPGFFDVVGLSGLTANEIFEPGVKPTTVLRRDKPWYIHVEWDTEGLLTPMIGGKWDFHAYLESMGPGPEVKLTDPADHEIELHPDNSPVHYHHNLDVAANTVTEDGPYKLVVTVTYINMIGKPGPLAGYWEGPILQFHTY